VRKQSINISDIEVFFEKKILGTLRFKPGLAGWKA